VVCVGAGAGWRRGRVAGRAHQRLVGLLGRRGLALDEALVLPRCRSVHTLGMRTAIDVLLLDADGTVLAIHAWVRPGRTVGDRRARTVVEAAPGSAARHGIACGDRLALVDRPP
jgi:uncharacterized protein